MLQILKVAGQSLSPGYLPGDFVLVLKIPFLIRKLRKGDVVVFQHSDYGVMIKRVDSISSDGEEFMVIGDHPDSTDSREFGAIGKASLVGKVILHISRPRSNLL